MSKRKNNPSALAKNYEKLSDWQAVEKSGIVFREPHASSGSPERIL
jgi:hypothetical protein